MGRHVSRGEDIRRMFRLKLRQIRQSNGENMAAIAVLDDYQRVALKMADWSGLTDDHKIKVFHEPFASTDAAADALKGYDIVCAMRERTLFSRELIQRLPTMKLLVTTGMRNAAIDMKAAADHRIVVCGTDGPPRRPPNSPGAC